MTLIYLFVVYIRLVSIVYDRVDKMFSSHPILTVAFIGALVIANKEEGKL